MIEMVYSSKETEEVSEVRVPKNIRQIGEGNQYRRIYIEDYVMATLKREPQNEDEIKYGVLLGEVKRTKENTYVFIKGMVETREIIENSVIFNDDIWSNIYKDIKRYFEGADIVGWFLSVPYAVKNDKSFIQKIHLDNFAGNDKLCYLNDRTEHEDGFFVYESGKMQKTPGYYIFYEKNEKMKKYLKQQQDNRGTSRDIVIEEADMKKASSETAKKVSADSLKMANASAIKKGSKVPEFIENGGDKKREGTVHEEPVHMTFRDVIKKQMDEEQVKTSRMGNFAYGVSSVLIVALLLSTVVMLNNYGELKSIKSSIENMSGDNSVAVVNEILSSVIPSTVSSETDAAGNDITENVEAGVGANNNQEYPDNVYEGEDGQLYTKDVVESSDSSDEAEDSAGNLTENGEDSLGDEHTQSNSSDNSSYSQSSDNSLLNSGSDKLELEANSEYGQEAALSGGSTYHTVEPGQTLYDISISYYGDLSMVERIMEVNGIDNQDMIQAGQELIIPR